MLEIRSRLQEMEIPPELCSSSSDWQIFNMKCLRQLLLENIILVKMTILKECTPLCYLDQFGVLVWELAVG